ncbi:hypothetical protein [Bremerella cremea]|uniref:hypothetical protein n=1 Tax=Bremerella cremea TaxID=1031537 RepID=UPI0013141749|nr:hypothetical protein [Bremerella cremea]
MATSLCFLAVHRELELMLINMLWRSQALSTAKQRAENNTKRNQEYNEVIHNER